MFDVAQFDHHDAGIGKRMNEVYADLRRECPVGWSEQHGGFWVATGYHEIHDLARNHEALSSSAGLIPDVLGGHVLIPISLDPPEHTQYRGLLQRWFTLARINQFEEYTRRRAREMVHDLPDRCDIVQAYARPLPLEIILHVIGVPNTSMDTVAQAAEAVIELAGAELEDVMAKVGQAYAFLGSLVPDARTQPGDDLISFLATSKIASQPLPDEVVASIAFNLVGAGFDTTSKTLSSSLAFIAANPDHQRELRTLTDLSMAVEELLRLFAPVSVGRLVKEPLLCGGVSLAPGDRVLLAIPSSGRDHTIFDDADGVRFDRPNNRHLTFGSGIHRCLGMHLARMELRVMLEELFAATSWFEADPRREVGYSYSQVAGATSVPLVLRMKS